MTWTKSKTSNSFLTHFMSVVSKLQTVPLIKVFLWSLYVKAPPFRGGKPSTMKFVRLTGSSRAVAPFYIVVARKTQDSE